MKLALLRETLLKPLQMVMGVVEHKQTLPILANVLLTVENDQLSLTATDLEIELISSVQLTQTVTTPVRLTLPCRKLLDICRALPENAAIELAVEANNEKVLLRSGRSRYWLTALPADDFPKIEQYTALQRATLSQQKLRYLLQRTYFAMAQQDVRYYLNGLLLEFLPETVQAVATDGHRLALNSVAASLLAQEQSLQIIIPRKSVLELMRLLDSSEQDITLEIARGNIRIVGPDYIFTSKLLEGRFPDYQQAIPKDFSKKVLLNRDVFKQALSRSAILCNEKFRAVYFEFKENLLRILANNMEKESAEEEIEIDYPYEEIGVGFNVTYLLDVLSNVNGAEVSVTISGQGDSILLEEPGVDSAFVIMPVRM